MDYHGIVESRRKLMEFLESPGGEVLIENLEFLRDASMEILGSVDQQDLAVINFARGQLHTVQTLLEDGGLGMKTYHDLLITQLNEETGNEN